MMGYYILAGVLTLVGSIVSSRLKNKFSKYSQIPIRSGMRGVEVAQAMLDHYGVDQVKIVEGKGFLTDHYNPLTKTVSLSPQVYNGASIAAAAVAAHECGHAVQHDRSYAMLQMRSALVPLVNLSAKVQPWLLMIALGALGNGIPGLMLATIAVFAVTTLFSFVTLPVEFDASRRALVWLDESGVTKGEEYDGAKDALWWAAMTYVSAALSALVILLYLILRYASSRR
jgi:hypothetical protein